MLGFASTLDEAFREGIDLARQGQFERADVLLRKCVVGDPANSDYVTAFLENLSLKSPVELNTAPTKEGLSEPLAPPLHEKNWQQVLQRGPEQLSLTPWHVPTLLAMAEAYEAEELGSEEAEYLEQALQVAPQDGTINRRAAKAFTRLGRIDAAIACWQRVELAEPSDADATSQVADLVVTKCRQQAGLEPRTPDNSLERPKFILRAEATDARPRVAGEATASELNLTPIQRWEAAIRERPADPHLYEELTKLYLEKDRDYDAERMLAKAKSATDNDPTVVQLWENVTLLRLDKKIAQARKKVEADPSEESRIAWEVLQRERDETEVKIFGERCKREPTNAELHFQYGLRLKRAGRESEASQHFQTALDQGQVASASAYELAQCCERFGQVDQALRYYRLTANASHEPGDQARKLDALYRASRIALGLQLFALSKRYVAELLAVAPGNREGLALRREIDRRSAQDAPAG